MSRWKKTVIEGLTESSGLLAASFSFMAARRNDGRFGLPCSGCLSFLSRFSDKTCNSSALMVSPSVLTRVMRESLWTDFTHAHSHQYNHKLVYSPSFLKTGNSNPTKWVHPVFVATPLSWHLPVFQNEHWHASPSGCFVLKLKTTTDTPGMWSTWGEKTHTSTISVTKLLPPFFKQMYQITQTFRTICHPKHSRSRSVV